MLSPIKENKMLDKKQTTCPDPNVEGFVSLDWFFYTDSRPSRFPADK